MEQAGHSVPVTTLGAVSAATVIFRLRGQLHLTAVVKATFALVPEGRMTPLAPDPIVRDEVPDSSGLGLHAAADLAPRLARADILLTGHAELPQRFSAPDIRVGLAVVRDGAMCVDRSLELDASARVGPARTHVHIYGAGPISREWPRRSQLLGAIDPQRLRGPFLDIPDALDWTYFQAAPAEQRMELLRGDEWLILGGVFAQRPRLRTQLPDARGVARVYRRGQAAPRAGTPIVLVADTLQVDADRRCASIVWRGDTTLDEADLASLHVVAGVEVAGRALAWSDPFPPEIAPLPEPPTTLMVKLVQRPPENVLEGTFMMPDDSALMPGAAPAMPFEKHPAPDPPRERVSLLAMAARMPARGPVKHRPQQAPRQAPEAANALSGTFTLPDDAASILATAPATPFDRPPPTESPLQPPEQAAPPATAPTRPLDIVAEAANPLAGTFTLPDDTAFSLATAPVIPFVRAHPAESSLQPSPKATPSKRPRDIVPEAANPLSGTFTLPDDAALRLAEAPATPFEKPRGVDPASLDPRRLGDAFLIAMEAAGEQA